MHRHSLSSRQNVIWLVFGLIYSAYLLVFWYKYGLQLTPNTYIDAKSYWLAAKLVWIERISPYSEDFFAMSEIMTGEPVFPYVYPPPSLVLFLPLAPLDFEAAWVLLLILNHAAILLLYLCIFRIVVAVTFSISPGLLMALGVTTILIGLSQASRVTLGHGQVNYIVLSGLLLFLLAFLGCAPRLVGAAGLVVATLLKPYFGVFILFALIPRGFRLFVPIILVSAALTLATLLLLPVTFWTDWVAEYLLNDSYDDLYLGYFEIYRDYNYSLRALIGDLAVATGMSRDAPSLVWKMTSWLLVAMIACQVFFIVKFRNDTEWQVVLFCALLLLVFLASPISWQHYILYGAVASTILTLLALQNNQFFLSGSYALVLLLLLQPSFFQEISPGLRYLPTLAFLLLWCVVMLQLWLPRENQSVGGPQ